MSRLEKKCFIVSAVLHGLLVATFLFGSAFLSPHRKADLDIKPLTMVPAKLVDGLSGGGGNPNIHPTEERLKGETMTPQPPTPPPVDLKKVEQTPEPPKPAPQPKPKPTPQKKDEIKLPKTSPKDSIRPKDDAKKTTEKQPRVDLTKVVPRSNRITIKANPDAEAKERAAAAEQAAKQRALATLRDATSRLKEGFASGTVVQVSGTGGEAYADYAQFVRAVYDEAWIVSDEVSDDNSIAEVTVTIARNGDVIFKRVNKSSGNPVLDKSVRRALDEVRSIGRPFPEGAKESQRTFTIEFNLKAKRAFG